MNRVAKIFVLLIILCLGMNTLSAKHYEQNETVNLDNVDEIIIVFKELTRITFGFNLVSIKTEITSHGDDQLLAHLDNDVSFAAGSSLPMLQVEQRGRSVKIYFTNKRKIAFDIFRYGKINLDVKIPENYRGKVKIESSIHDVYINELIVSELELKNGTGKTELVNVYADRIQAHNSTGNMFIDGIDCNEAKITGSCGNIDCGHLIVKNGRFENSTGNIKIASLIANDTYIKNSTGTIKIEEISGKITMRSSLGTVKVKVKEFTDDIEIENKTGTTKLWLPQNSAFNYRYFYGCGSVRFDFNRREDIDGTKGNAGTVNGGGPMLRATVGSGSLKILPY